jgi:molecular chaperone IbpA
MASGYPNSWEKKHQQWDKYDYGKIPATTVKPQTLADLLSAQFFLGFQDQINRWNTLTNYKTTTFPPYNLIKVNDDQYTVEIALAGYKREDIEVTVEKDLLVVKSVEKEDETDDQILHQGIAKRLWTQKFVLGEWMEVKEATLKDGLLTIKVEREVPEEAKPKVIKVK